MKFSDPYVRCSHTTSEERRYDLKLGLWLEEVGLFPQKGVAHVEQGPSSSAFPVITCDVYSKLESYMA